MTTKAMSMNYTLHVSRRGDDHLVEAPEFRIVRHGADLTVVIETVRAEIENVIEEYKQAGIELPAVGGASNVAATTAKNEQPSSSGMRVAIASAAVLFVILIGGAAIKVGVARIQSQFSGVSTLFSGGKLAHHMSDGVAVAADTLENITPERREEIVNNLRRIAVSLEPYAAQLRPLMLPETIDK